MGTEQWGTHLPEGLSERAHEWREAHDENKSRTIQRLVERGLEAEQDDDRGLLDEVRFGSVTAALVTAPTPIISLDYIFIPLAYLLAVAVIVVWQQRALVAATLPRGREA